jgi:hypothetical protein
MFLFSHAIQAGSGANPVSYGMGTGGGGGGYSSGLKLPVREADHPISASVEVRNTCKWI